MDFGRLKSLLEEQETFPHDFTVKFIGANSQAFTSDVHALENRHPGLRKQAERSSTSGANLSLTYAYPAETADQIIMLLKEVSAIRDVRVVL